MSNKLVVKGKPISFYTNKEKDYISLTDIAKHKNPEHPRFVIQNWMKSRSSVEYLGLWEQINNPKFNRIEFDTVKSNSGLNSFVLTPKRWIETVNPIGITSKPGRYGGTYAHKDIAFEFASWISPEFKLFLIKEFQRLKEKELSSEKLEWDVKRMLAKVNYKVHTSAVARNLIPNNLSNEQINHIYANEADVLNVALYGITAKEWREANPNKKGNMRDYSTITQLVCLAGLESLNAEFIRQDMPQKDRLIKLNEIAIIQMRALTADKSDIIRA
jgi:hypothetical protein